MKRTCLAAAAVVLLAPGFASAQFYLSGDVGADFSSGPYVVGRDDDRGPVCDEFINPSFADVPGCTDPRQRGDTWTGPFDGAAGVLAGAAAGYSLRRRFPDHPLGRLRLEAEYFHRRSDRDQETDVRFEAGSVSAAAHQAGEFTARDRLGRMAGNHLFGNLYLDFFGAGRFTPYAGFGAGIGLTDADYGASGMVNTDPARITSVTDLPNADEIRRNVAGTVFSEQARLSDALFGYQILFGADYALTESLSLGVKGRRVDFGTFEDGGEWDLLRSHESQLRLDGSEPVTYLITIDGIASFVVSLNLKYHF